MAPAADGVSDLQAVRLTRGMSWRVWSYVLSRKQGSAGMRGSASQRGRQHRGDPVLA